ncbi:hypothetical protein PV08_01030 [Exophiala spinifera]|uniref:Uncharacterized protein n=1 Tax=Exophiala spinifera TaxID=91928 RepID=A0A0D2BPK1_9EURO|nr:uncharacterized protein PV08_01030 [Exophiala spinifera]KIW20455.1 hypothetical protein PV08_01030 [Exophiala spinifera]
MDVANGGDEEAEPGYNDGSLPTSPSSKTDVSPIEYYENRPEDLAAFVQVRSESARVEVPY